MTLMVSSHILAELEEYSTSMVIIREGKIIEHQQLANRREKVMLVRVVSAEPSGELTTLLSRQEHVEVIKSDEQSCLFHFKGDNQGLHQILRVLISNNIPVYRFGEEKINMHDAYLQTVSDFELATQKGAGA